MQDKKYEDILEAKEERKEVKVNPDIFDQYVGRYQVTPDIFTDVTREGDKLIIQTTTSHLKKIFWPDIFEQRIETTFQDRPNP